MLMEDYYTKDEIAHMCWYYGQYADNLTYNQNGRVMKLLTKLSIQNLLHPFQTFILGQKRNKIWVLFT